MKKTFEITFPEDRINIDEAGVRDCIATIARVARCLRTEIAVKEVIYDPEGVAKMDGQMRAFAKRAWWMIADVDGACWDSSWDSLSPMAEEAWILICNAFGGDFSALVTATREWSDAYQDEHPEIFDTNEESISEPMIEFDEDWKRHMLEDVDTPAPYCRVDLSTAAWRSYCDAVHSAIDESPYVTEQQQLREISDFGW